MHSLAAATRTKETERLLKYYSTLSVPQEQCHLSLQIGLMRSANSPPAAARTREKEVFARTPRAPAKGCRPLRSCFVAVSLNKNRSSLSGKGLPPSALLLSYRESQQESFFSLRQRGSALCRSALVP